MRPFFVALAVMLLLAPVVQAGEGSVVKVLPQLLDDHGRHALSPSLYERCLLGDDLHTVTLEEPAVKNGHFSSWSEFRIEGADYKTFGQIVAWQVTLWEGDHQISQLESFLWSPVATGH